MSSTSSSGGAAATGFDAPPSGIDGAWVRALASRAIAEGRSALTELEGMDILDAMGLATPRRRFVGNAAEARALMVATGGDESGTGLPGAKVVVKVVSAAILHKTEAGGVTVAPNSATGIESALAEMEARFADTKVDGYSINEFVTFEPSLGREIIMGYRLAPDFGPIVSLGFGGIYAEFIANTFRPGTATVFLSAATADRALIEQELSRNALQAILAGGLRGTRPLVGPAVLAELAATFVRAAPILAAAGILEFEVNPFALTAPGGSAGPAGWARLVALDALAKLGELPSGLALASGAAGPRIVNPKAESRPLAKIERLLKPASAAVIGVSGKVVNNGRIILRNMLKNGFEIERIYVVKPDAAEIDGCRCVPDVASLPEKVDLFILVVPAASAPAVLADLVEADKAESVIVIPGGFEEKAGTEAITARMAAALERARATAPSGSGGGPIIVGGNCLGILSAPGRYNTLFIPEHKLPLRTGTPDPVALVSQSGAFAITRLSKHPKLAPEYVITCGNQMDATVGDFLEYLADDESIRIFAVYIEGFKPLDGEKVLRACARISSSGRTVIVYRAGRSPAGAAASASHTASIAGDYPVTRALFAQAGAIVAQTLDEFDDALSAFTLLRGKDRGGSRLGALSNAGFECVAAADNLGRLELASFCDATKARLAVAFAKAGIGDIVDVHNPLDLTPMAGRRGLRGMFPRDPGGPRRGLRPRRHRSPYGGSAQPSLGAGLRG